MIAQRSVLLNNIWIKNKTNKIYAEKKIEIRKVVKATKQNNKHSR